MSQTSAVALGISTLALAMEDRPSQVKADSMLAMAQERGTPWLDTSRFYRQPDECEPYGLLRAQTVMSRSPSARVVLRVGLQWRNGIPSLCHNIEELRIEIEESLEVLRAPVDTILLHTANTGAALGEALSVLHEMRRSGATTRVGISNATRADIEPILAHGVDMLQYRMNWFNRSILKSRIPEILDNSQCHLSTLDADSPSHQGWRAESSSELIQLSAMLKCSPRAAELAWCGSQVTGPHFVTVHSMDDVMDVVDASRLDLIRALAPAHSLEEY